MESMFEIGDLVKIKGYSSVFRVVGYFEDGEEECYRVRQYLLEDYVNELVAYPEDMRIATDAEIDEYEYNPLFYMREFNPPNVSLKPPKLRIREEEKKVLEELAENRGKIEKLKHWQDWYLDMYRFTSNKKYLRRVEKISKIINTIPTRAFQIKNG
ncbi:hypothetical protein [Thermoactinomyces sp. CICC 23799]|jgi:hypothetical protein|uniref:hypothetical protein n=1 Tax=Thermoactinomyces sp. CICC 23799 TaxID=2767429 RepID=UPI0018DD6661|nr:hypothetical protein [Thermoactinomyces sp. CICC 23799]MBH8600935.1 hypothetical protein [Thermoactinomyces sp. CICC 23799]